MLSSSIGEHAARRQLSINQEMGSHQTWNLVVPRCWTSQLPELWEMNVFVFYFLLFGHTLGIWKSPGQELNLSCSSDLHHSCGNIISLTHCVRLGIEPIPHQWPEWLQRQHWILNLLCHSGNSFFFFPNKRFLCKPPHPVYGIFVIAAWMDWHGSCCLMG